VGVRCWGVSVYFVQNEPVRIVGLLKDVEAEVSRFLDCISGVFQRGVDERLAKLRLDVNVDANQVHGNLS
jgi:hypothetical protein